MSVETVVVILVAVSVGAIVKGLSGLGLPMVSIPLMAGFLGVEHAVALMVIPTLLTNTWQIWVYRAERASFSGLRAAVTIGVAGVVAGTWVLASVPERLLLALMAFWLGLYLIALALRFEPRIDKWQGRWPSYLVIWLAGVMQGATGAAGPIVGPYAHALGLRKGAYVFAVSVLFQVFAVSQLVALGWYGIITWERIVEGLIACIPVLALMPLAMRISVRFSVRTFELMLMAVFLLMEARLIYRIFA